MFKIEDNPVCSATIHEGEIEMDVTYYFQVKKTVTKQGTDYKVKRLYFKPSEPTSSEPDEIELESGDLRTIIEKSIIQQCVKRGVGNANHKNS